MRRLARAAASTLAMLIATASVLLGGALPAQAYTVTYDRFDIDYTVGTDGTTRVKETITVRFGSGSGRHGYQRELITREKYSSDQDVKLDVSNITVTSPDPGVSTKTAVSTQEDPSTPRNVMTVIKIGDANKTIASPTATYNIEYDVKGFLRNPKPDFDEFYVDALGPDLANVKTSTVSVTVPQGPVNYDCWAGPVKGSTPCTSKTVQGQKAVFTQTPLSSGSIFSVDVALKKGAAGDASPILVESATAASERQTLIGMVTGGLAALAAAVGSFFYYRPRLRDERFAGMPPGTFPPAGASGATEPNRLKEVPVSFAPPKLPLMHAGYLLEGQTKTQHLTATLIGLATAGAIQLRSSQDGQPPVAVPVDRSKAPDEPSLMLFDGLFGARPQPVALDTAGSLLDIHNALSADAEAAGASQNWFKRTSSGRRSGGGLGGLWVILMGFFFMGGGPFLLLLGPLLWVLIPVTLVWVITQAVLRTKLARGQRTGLGRAWTDQIEGFRTYIATAEANQLKFEEGEDIFTRYLPWAVLFGLAERWTKVCEQAIQLGLLQTPDTYWYGGGVWDPYWVMWNINTFDDSMTTTAMPEAPSVSSSDFGGSGFGGGSGFDSGGGFSGGGFGGGGGDGW